MYIGIVHYLGKSQVLGHNYIIKYQLLLFDPEAVHRRAAYVDMRSQVPVCACNCGLLKTDPYSWP